MPKLLYVIFARNISKIPKFYMTFARKMPEFYMAIARKILFPNFGWHVPPSPLPLSALHLLRLCRKRVSKNGLVPVLVLVVIRFSIP